MAIAYALAVAWLSRGFPALTAYGYWQPGLPLALAALLRFGGRCWPALLAGAAWLAWRNGLAVSAAAPQIAAMLGAALLSSQALRPRASALSHLPGVLRYLFGAALCGSLLSALGWFFAQLPSADPARAAQDALRIALGDMAAMAALPPLLLLNGHSCMATPERRRETVAVGMLTLCLSLLVCVWLDGRDGRYAALPYLFIMPLLWLAFRSQQLLAHVLSLAIVAFALRGAHLERGALSIVGERAALLNVALLALVQSVALLVFGALLAERRSVERSLMQANQSLESKVAERTAQLAESEARLRLLADAAPFPLAMNRLSGGELNYANARAEELFDTRIEASGSQKVQDFYADPDECERVAQVLRAGGRVMDREVRLKGAGGREFWALISCAVVKSDKVWHVINSINDISERKRLEQSLRDANTALRRQVGEIEHLQQGLREQARRDPLTGLFNRRHLDDILPRVLSHMLALHREVAVLMVDADHFKRVNDTYGHRCGDIVLTALAAYLSDHFRSGDIVCRYGGEEFFVLLPGASLEAAHAKAQGLCDAVRAMPIQAQGHALTVTLSVGLALSPMHGEDAESVVHAADAALYQAKQTGRDRVCVAAPLQSLLLGEG
ncbi:diguanylate cyclase [Chromobacterium sp. IIBBL 290-4]|uniref:sensor domain-containing diguanylate cyclase n=1 Tax=Chromobacterium sp. IIBBL 290-4 TaxID=2953890 RepID=UPI0020B8DFE8|nr:diguanylate cyclase [Chromobacterium sp. IIBBL 290-4]UTH76064.1 sensor domain-containing diguanylate cyclase [Chromobacterium sp. IIBBL 290-4]